MKKLLITFNYYSKEYIEETNTTIYTLLIKNSLWNISIKINTNEYNTIIDILSNDKCIFYYSVDQQQLDDLMIKCTPLEYMLFTSQEFLENNELLIYVEGFGLPAYNNSIDIYQSTPKLKYNESTINNYFKDR